MKNEILTHLNDPVQLERLYRSDKAAFKRAFNALAPEINNSTVTGFWLARLNSVRDDRVAVNTKDLIFVIIASLLAGIIAKLPAFLQIDEDMFYSKNIGFTVFPFLAAYFAWKNKLAPGRIICIALLFISSAVFINLLPDPAKNNTTMLSGIHLLLFLWAVTGWTFVGKKTNDLKKRLDYLKYNGDLAVMTALILIAGGVLTAVTIGLFSLIGLRIETFYFEYVVVFGLSAAPLVGTYLINTNPQLVGKVSPVIARVFSPLVLIMLIAYLIAITWSGKDPYNDREFLLMFNVLLLGVMAIIFFSVAETAKAVKARTEIWILLMLSVVTIIVNSIALSAIVFRISEWGFTPNRTAVLGANLLMLIHLLLVTVQLFRVILKKSDITPVSNLIARYLPVYVLWVIIVTFFFPILFGFK